MNGYGYIIFAGMTLFLILIQCYPFGRSDTNEDDEEPPKPFYCTECGHLNQVEEFEK